MRTFKGAMSNKGLGDWEQHTRGIGAKLLLQMGFQPGKGLGKSLQGISAPVEAHLRKGRGAIGAYGPEKKTKIADLKGVVKKNEKEKATEERGSKQWSKKSHKDRYFYKSVEDVIEKGKKPDYILYDLTSTKHNKVTVIDMTGPEKRVLSGYHALGQMKISEDEVGEKPDLKHFQLPELMHNLNLIVNMCEQEIIANDKRQRTAEDRQRSLMSEKEQLENIVGLEKKYVEQLEDVEELVERLLNSDNPPTLEDAEKIFRELKINFSNEFKEFSLSDLAPGIIAPLITASMREWKPLEEPTKHVNTFKKWAELLDYSSATSSTVFEPYPALIWSTIIPCFRKAAVEWSPKNHAKMAALLDGWSSLLPEWMLDNVLDQIVLSRLTQAVSEWDPLTDIVPIHTWILPWSKILGNKMHENVYKTICEKLSKAFRAWHPSDRSALAMIKPWKAVFRDEDLAIFLYKNVLPKIEFRMSEIVFNPLQQDLEIFNQVWGWNELFSPLVMANILDKYFFPKWMQTLVLWLNQSPNFDELSRWYTGWKGLFNNEAVLKQPTISEHFRRALELMQRAAGITISMPEPIIQHPQIDVNVIPPSNINLEYKEIVSQKCAMAGIIFAPMPGRRENGKQVYRIGKLFCYFEKSVCCVSSDPGNSQAYMPMSLNAILEKAK
jgi:tuftelin-interacting protein 11